MMSHGKVILLALLGLIGSTNVVFCAATPDTLTVNIEPKQTDNFAKASFSLRIPEKVESVRYILVLLSGFNGSGRGLLEHEEWLQFATESNGAMLACTLKMEKDTPHHYAAAQYGSGAALERAIEELDKKCEQHDLKRLPLLIYGHSAGGQFAYGFSCHNPKRMIGFAATKGGYYFPEPVAGTYNVPGLIVSGAKDQERRRRAICDLFESHRRKGAPWCWMEDGKAHGQANCLAVVIPYFREILRLQLEGEENGMPDRSKLVGLSVDLADGKIVSEKKVFGADDTDVKQGWLPSKAVFNAWSEQDTGSQKYTENRDASDD